MTDWRVSSLHMATFIFLNFHSEQYSNPSYTNEEISNIAVKKNIASIIKLMLHRISKLNTPASVDYKRLRKACNTNTKSERGPEWTDETPSDD